MKTNLKISLVAGLLMAASLAYSQGPMAGQRDMTGPHGAMQGQSMGHHGMGKMDPAKMQVRMEARQAALKAQLKLTPEQEAAWTTFSASHKMPVGMKDQQAAMPDLANLTTPERLDKMKELRAQHMGEMTAVMDQRAEATKTFYAVLTPEQQKVFDAQSMQGRGSHMGMRGGKGMMQPKM